MYERRNVEFRCVHAKRARKLRKRGEYVFFYDWSPYGHCLYMWEMKGSA